MGERGREGEGREGRDEEVVRGESEGWRKREEAK